MAKRTYRPLQMHRIAYTDLTAAQVTQLLRPAATGPASRNPTSEALVGRKLRIVTDGGPMLEYSFISSKELVLVESGGKAVRAGYGALESRQLVLVTHMIPGTQRGYKLVVDQQSNLATVFEIHFSGYAAEQAALLAAPAPAAAGAAPAAPRQPQFRNGHRNREVFRKVHFGYVDKGGAAPAERHVWTNRLEGKGIHWSQDNDIEILEFYLSITFSNIIELTRFGGEMTVAAPSDYVMVNDHQFIYTRVESEFSGTLTLQLIDLFDLTQKGVRLGINDKDELEYYMYSGKGEITGQIATFEVFGNNSETRPAGPRRVYRPLETFEVMTDEQVKDQVLNHAHAFGDGAGSGASGMGGYRSGKITKFAGKSLTVSTGHGGPNLEYQFAEKDLKWRYSGDANWREAWYEMYEPDDEVYFFAHLLDAEFPRSCAMVCFDMKNGLATIVKGTTGTPFRNNETTPNYYFGTFRTEGSATPPTYQRHGWTDEMTGECVTWNYARGNPGLTSMHFYATPQSYSWIIFQPDGSGGMQWTSPGWYSKVRDGLYIMAWVEEACNGTLGVICFNQRTMHDAGFGFHVGSNGLSLSVVGARARHAGKFDIEKYLGPKA
jgi:hypothetical protein